MKTFSQFLLEATDPKGPIKKYMSPEEIAKKHKISVDALEPELKLGIKVEHEHTGDKRMARMIALQHLEELPDYYTRLKKAEKVNEENDNDPCWSGYTQVGMKTKKGRKVPNCVPSKGVKKAKGYKKESYDYSNWREEFKAIEYEFFDVITPDPIKSSSVSENYTRVQSRGTTYSIVLNWRGKYLGVQMFFPQFTRPSKEQVSFEVRKLYPGAMVLSFNPAVKDPTKPLLFTGEINGSK